MTKREKRLKKVRQTPKNVTKEELDIILKDFGFELSAGKGSHTVYQHSQLENPIVIAVHGTHVPAYIVKQALEAIDQIISEVEQDEDEND
ncbi:MAG: type II toxin-antitoxin system HicA family toxin [Anaerolineae bacterium]|nr:type II toxin-antitoxin system HicA family toxin [Anaerolineae bacterium]